MDRPHEAAAQARTGQPNPGGASSFPHRPSRWRHEDPKLYLANAKRTSLPSLPSFLRRNPTRDPTPPPIRRLPTLPARSPCFSGREGTREAGLPPSAKATRHQPNPSAPPRPARRFRLSPRNRKRPTERPIKREAPRPAAMGGGSRSRAKEADGESEVRPGGMFVQRRDGEEGPTVRLRVSHGPALRDVFVPAQATFGELKRILAQTTGLEPERQRLFFRGKEKRDDEFLHASGAKDGAKLLLLEKHVPANVEQKVEPVMMDESMMRACEAVVRVRSEVDKLSAKVCELEKSVLAGKKVEDKEFVVLTELLMVQLLKLDGIEAEGEARAQRKAEVRRVQNLVETLDKLKARNANPFSDSAKSVSVSTEWETFENGVGSLNAPPARFSSTQNDTDWEQFD
uniref:BAG family molecular chaperone regulator 4 n=4 Tax=Aegilops tauschii subsp. strangulata TaxID=200361 RepID=A0A453FUX8_AEGTS